MNLVHGREITAEQVELIVGREFPVHRFPSMCNAILWSLSRTAGISQVSFTERVFVADNGVDGELVIVTPPYTPTPGSLLIPGNSVVQYKQRDITARERNRIIADLGRDLRGAAREVSERRACTLNQYLLFTNISLTIVEKHKLEEVIKEGSAELSVQIFGAAEIAAILNNLPHLRSAYFSTARFTTWHRFWEGYNRLAPSGAVPALVGRKEVLSATKTAIDDGTTRAVVISGGPDIGKTRLALDATQHRPFDTVIAIEGRTLTLTDLLALVSPGNPVVVIIDDPDESTAASLISTALSEELTLVMTLPTSEAANVVNYGRDPRIKVVTLDPLTDAESRELLVAAGGRMDEIDSHRIAVAGHSFGGQLTLLAAERDKTLRAAVTFAGAAGSWERSPELRERLISAIHNTNAAIMLTHAETTSAPPREMRWRQNLSACTSLTFLKSIPQWA